MLFFSEITGVMSSQSSEEESNQASLHRKKLNEFLVESGMKDTHIGPPKKAWEAMEMQVAFGGLFKNPGKSIEFSESGLMLKLNTFLP